MVHVPDLDRAVIGRSGQQGRVGRTYGTVKHRLGVPRLGMDVPHVRTPFLKVANDMWGVQSSPWSGTPSVAVSSGRCLQTRLGRHTGHAASLLTDDSTTPLSD